MNTPGVSLFQGAETLKVNSTLERQEEEEALQDQKRREAELGNLLENAFDDLDDDDNESTIDSTTNFPSSLLPPLPALPTAQPQHQQQLDYANGSNEMHKLKMLLESKTRELSNINKLATEAQKKTNDYLKRVTITEAELERARREKQHAHELLVDSKEKCSHLEDDVAKLRSDKKKLEAENTQLVGKLETAQTLLDDVQRKYAMVERDLHRHDDHTAELRLKQLEEQHRAQSELSQHQLSQLADQLDKKQQELDQMHMRYNALQSSHETMLLDKADKINELNTALDVAQRRCNQLTATPTFEAEYTRQQQCIADLHRQMGNMEQTIAELTDRLHGTSAEMDLMDTLMQQHQSDVSESPSQAKLQLPANQLIVSTPLNPVERLSKFKQDLYRTFGMMKSKREEVRKLEKQLDERNIELRSQRNIENKMLVELATMKDDNMRLESKVKVLHDQLEQRQQNASLSDRKFHSDLEELTKQRQEIEQRLEKANMELDELRREHEKLQRQHNELKDENSQLRMRSTADNLVLELERHKILLKDSRGEVDRLKKLYTDIANDKESLSYQLRKLSELDSSKELQEQRQQLAQLQCNLQLAELKSQELAKLLEAEKQRHERDLETVRLKYEKQKLDLEKVSKEGTMGNCSKCSEQLAEITKMEIQMLKLQNLSSLQAKQLTELSSEFDQLKSVKLELEEKLRLQQHYDSPVPQAGAAGDARAEEGSASPEFSQTRVKQIEQRVRDEMAKLFAAELKRSSTRLQQAEERSLCLHREYQLVCRDLMQRQTEVDLLKETILAERDQMKELLCDKDEKQKQMLQKCHDELQAKNQRIADLVREMDEQHASIESERCSMRALMTEWNKQKDTMGQLEEHWQQKMQTLHESNEEALRIAEKRYQSAKRTAQNYKLYADDKDAYMKRELDRIKQEYHDSLATIKAKMHQHLQSKQLQQQQQQEHQLPKAKTSTKNKENEPSNR
ncbi:protein lava lamp [Drosophila nasuta]|uniref:protein lava lamp n=1 Tax=Drosophila nasuta TaxID=42062 RepID=UPI00295F0854|nr:protein lava lamp [Drosophila nasuta]